MKKSNLFCLFLLVLFLFSKISYSQEDNDFRVSLSFDPKMIIVGPYSHSEQGEWDLLLRFAYRNKHMEYSLFAEAFKSISYGAAGVNINYLFYIKEAKNQFNRWEFGVGPGFGLIVRKELDLKENFIEFNGEARYFFNNGLGVMLLGNLKYRSDLVVKYDEDEPWRLSSFVGLIYRW